MALAYYAIVPNGNQEDVTSGDTLSHQVALTVVTWDDSEVTTKDQVITHLELIKNVMENSDFYNSVTNASDPRGYIVLKGDGEDGVVWRNATADTDSVLDNGDGHVALEGYSEVNAPKAEILADLEQLRIAVLEGDFPIA